MYNGLLHEPGDTAGGGVGGWILGAMFGKVWRSNPGEVCIPGIATAPWVCM